MITAALPNSKGTLPGETFL